MTSGYVFSLGGGAVSWQSKRQPSVSLATADAEYVGLSQAGREAMWLRAMLGELGYKPNEPTMLYGDNQASIVIALNPVAHTRSKQIDIRFHYVRELVERECIKIQHVPSLSMAADGLTKPLAPVMFERFIKLLGLSTRPFDNATSLFGSSKFSPSLARSQPFSTLDRSPSSLHCTALFTMTMSTPSPIKNDDTTTTTNSKLIFESGVEFTPPCDKCLRLNCSCVRLLDSHPLYTRKHPQPLKKCYCCTRAGNSCKYTKPDNQEKPEPKSNEGSEPSDQTTPESEEGAPIIHDITSERAVSGEPITQPNEGPNEEEIKEAKRRKIAAAVCKVGDGLMEFGEALME